MYHVSWTCLFCLCVALSRRSFYHVPRCLFTSVRRSFYPMSLDRRTVYVVGACCAPLCSAGTRDLTLSDHATLEPEMDDATDEGGLGDADDVEAAVVTAEATLAAALEALRIATDSIASTTTKAAAALASTAVIKGSLAVRLRPRRESGRSGAAHRLSCSRLSAASVPSSVAATRSRTPPPPCLSPPPPGADSSRPRGCRGRRRAGRRKIGGARSRRRGVGPRAW